MGSFECGVEIASWGDLADTGSLPRQSTVEYDDFKERLTNKFMNFPRGADFDALHSHPYGRLRIAKAIDRSLKSIQLFVEDNTVNRNANSSSVNGREYCYTYCSQLLVAETKSSFLETYIGNGFVVTLASDLSGLGHATLYAFDPDIRLCED